MRPRPLGRAEVNFRILLPGGGDLDVRVVHLVVLDRLLRATTKKGRQLFWGKKCTPVKILATPIGSGQLGALRRPRRRCWKCLVERIATNTGLSLSDTWRAAADRSALTALRPADTRLTRYFTALCRCPIMSVFIPPDCASPKASKCILEFVVYLLICNYFWFGDCHISISGIIRRRLGT